MRITTLSIAVLLLSACKLDHTGQTSENDDSSPAAAATATLSADPLGSHDDAPTQSDDVPRPVMQAQVVLDRLGFTPGVIDGKEGLSTTNALLGFQEANDLTRTGKLDEDTLEALARWTHISATRVVTVPADFAAGPFIPLPEKPEQQAALPAMGYESLDEKLAERFHTTVETLIALNPRPAGSGVRPVNYETANPQTAYFSANQQIRVPNVGADEIVAGHVKNAVWLKTLSDLGVGSEQPKAAKIVVSKSRGTLKAYDGGGKLVGMFTATMGSKHDPLPLGSWKVKGVAYNPPFHFNPELFWDVADSTEKQMLPPGPNGPVGVAWIDLNKEHYGIHGTPAPETIGRAQSHGCVRLTNWDIARLAQMVSGGTQVLFEA